MGKQSKPQKSESFGNSKVTPMQIAFIVDRYLCDNNLSETRSTFRNEASSLIANSPISQVPKSLLSLGEMLDEYICLKEQKVMVDQEKVIVEKEKKRVQMLLQGMQNVMNAYNASRSLVSPNVRALNAKSTLVPQRKPPLGVPASSTTTTITPPPTTTTMQNTSNIHPLPQSKNNNAENGNFSTPMVSVSDRKRKYTKSVDAIAPSVAKKSRGRSSNKRITDQGQNTLPQSSNAVNNQLVSYPSATQSSAGNSVPTGSQVQVGSSVVKCLFNQPSLSVPTTSPVSKTPSPPISPVPTCNKEATPTCYTVISTKRVMVSPSKQMAFVESGHCISPVKTDSEKVIKRDHVRSKLDFDASDNLLERLDKSLHNEISTSASDKDVDIFDDFPNFDDFGMDLSFTDMLSDLEIPCEEGIDFSYHPVPSHSEDIASGSSHECKANQVIINDFSSSATEALFEKDMNIPGPDCLTATKSVSKCIKTLSPGKNHHQGLDQENC